MNTREQPLVSVLMTVYNREKFISEAIESVLASHYQNWELIVVDDCSSDKSLEIARDFEKRDARIKVYSNEKNLTDYPNRNRAASYAKGKYIKYLDSDDIIYPYGLSIMVDRMEQFPDAGFGLVKLTFGNGPLPVKLTPLECYTELFLKGNFFFSNAPSSSIIRRDVFERTGGFSGLNQLGDMEYWLKLAATYPVVLIEGYLGFSRDHAGAERYKDSAKEKNRLRNIIITAALNSEHCPLDADSRERALKLQKIRSKNNELKDRLRRYLFMGRKIFKI